jgi:hypothetical protein
MGVTKMNKAISTLSLAILLLVTASCSDGPQSSDGPQTFQVPPTIEYYQSLLGGKTKAEIKAILGPLDTETVYGGDLGGIWTWRNYVINSSTEKVTNLRMRWDSRGVPEDISAAGGPEYPLK